MKPRRKRQRIDVIDRSTNVSALVRISSAIAVLAHRDPETLMKMADLCEGYADLYAGQMEPNDEHQARLARISGEHGAAN